MPVANETEVVDDLRSDPAVQAFLQDLEPVADVDPVADQSPSSQSTTDRAGLTDRSIGSAALESTLDSTIESSLLGMPAGSATLSALPGGPAIDLPVEVRSQVDVYLTDGHEVAAVRLICDEMGCGILDAMRTVRTLT